MRRLLLIAVLLGAATLAAPAAAVDQSKGRPGFCPGDTGVTVVIDFQQLGGTTLVRCFPDATTGTGLDALKGAGVQIAGVQRWGEAFICRIENRPAANEKIPVQGNENYQEACIDTPPAAGYWSYWHAGNNCSWQYSQWGVKNRSFTPGGFEGWSFSLNATADTNPVPRVAPVRPGTEGGRCTTAAEAPPTSDDPAEQQQSVRDGGSGGAAGGGPVDGSETTAEGGDLPAPLPRPESTPPDPADNVEFSGGEDARDVTEVIKEQAGASDGAPWAAAGVVVLLIGTALATAARRKRRREA